MNIIVLCGGLSAERDVSISSGTQIARALRERGHNAVLVDLYFGYTGHFEKPSDIFSKAPTDTAFSVSESEPDLEKVRASRQQDNDSAIGDNIMDICRAADIVFLALHGDIGENGKLQAAFDIAGVRYTGSGYLGSAIAMSKDVSKRMFTAAGILTPPGIAVHKGAEPYDNIGFPCVVKPCSGGSSVGTSIVHAPEDYQSALDAAFRYENCVIVEKYIEGREFTIGVFDGKAMPVIEIIPISGFYDYKNKYQAGLTLEICPAEISDSLTRQLQELAVRAHEALMVDVYSRIDCRMDGDGNIYCLETNTLPGMTPTSLIPQMAAAMGMSFPELCEKIIEISLEKYK